MLCIYYYRMHTRRLAPTMPIISFLSSARPYVPHLSYLVLEFRGDWSKKVSLLVFLSDLDTLITLNLRLWRGVSICLPSLRACATCTCTCTCVCVCVCQLQTDRKTQTNVYVLVCVCAKHRKASKRVVMPVLVWIMCTYVHGCGSSCQ